ncbi:hypothetical protein PTSG_12094 [Salpingoeca rosetta]|uniref:Fibronectin type-III domain-containing protein n=1 Tax=Salpingoeca rosetta (strain ATCC 50818 / BSB-021) TaxID=946362 RepID=F2U776_SALR5|nr:uncharacterized protein PTSG_12094 [Salpingoeca rosetta]EGD83293.1 hypothetical protein PTSG_12094 [Salpingoeca rosetta]|eukprot:XP_004994797.1 hypothetical protein PTSG_12094 [Salpingoeca rosetta]
MERQTRAAALLLFVVAALSADRAQSQSTDACTAGGLSARCACYESLPDRFVDCTSAGFDDIPTNIPVETTVLALAHNDITRIPGQVFNTLTNVRVLYLDGNGLHTLEPGAFSGMESLETLSLTENKLRNLTFFTNIPALRTLHLDNNLMEEIETEMFAGVPTLEEVTLADNKLTHLADRAFAHDNLKTLDLSGNRFSFISGLAFAGASALRTLDLTANRFAALAASVFEPLTNLTTLVLSDNDLESLPATIFSRQTVLATLKLDGNKLTTFDVDVIGSNPLRILRLDANELTTLSYNNDARWDNLLQLYMRDNAWYCCGMEWFRDAATIVQDSAAITCAAPQRVAGTMLQSTSGTIAVCDKLVPDAPAPVTATSPTSTSLLVQWDRPHGNYEQVESYTVEYQAVGASQWTQVTCTGGSVPQDPQVPATQLPCAFLDRDPATDTDISPLQTTITGLLPFTAYVVRVKATHSKGDGPYASSNTTTQEDLPAKPAAVTVVERYSRGLLVHVTTPVPANGVITHYTLHIETTAAAPGTVPIARNDTIAGTATSHTFLGLEPNSQYAVRVRAATSVGAGPWSDTTAAATREDAPERAPSVTRIAANETACTFEWSALQPNDTYGAVAVYNVYQATPAGNVTARLAVTTSDAFTWWPLAAGSQHHIVLSANTTAGEGPRTRVYECETAPFPPTKPANPTAVSVCAREVEVRWQPPAQPNGVVARYEVWQQGQQGAAAVRVYSGSNLSTRVTNLDPDTTYAFRVIAFTTLQSEQSDAAVVTTPTGAPPAVARPRLIRADANNMTLAWDDVVPCEGAVQAYLVYQVLQMQNLNYYPISKDSHPKLVGVAGGNVTRMLITDLVPATAYTFVVRARNMYGESNALHAATFVTKDAPPSRPGQPTVERSAGVQIVRWTRPEQPNGNVTRYVLWRIGDTAPLYDGHPGATLQITVQSDKPLSESLFVIAYNSAGSTRSFIEIAQPSSTDDRAVVAGVVTVAVILVLALAVLLYLKTRSKKLARVSEGNMSVGSVQPLVSTTKTPSSLKRVPSTLAPPQQFALTSNNDSDESEASIGARKVPGGVRQTMMTSTPQHTAAVKMVKGGDLGNADGNQESGVENEDSGADNHSNSSRTPQQAPRKRTLPSPPPPLNKEELQWTSSDESEDEDDSHHNHHHQLPGAMASDSSRGPALPRRTPQPTANEGVANPFAQQTSPREVVNVRKASGGQQALNPIRGFVQRPFGLPPLSHSNA